jgi:L-alanine-DL-glutamate epimerase-like enolase superfamily enzyme
MPNLDIVEHWIGDNPLSVIAAAPPPRDGAREVIHRPGLGLDVDETKVRALAQ